MLRCGTKLVVPRRVSQVRDGWGGVVEAVVVLRVVGQAAGSWVRVFGSDGCGDGRGCGGVGCGVE